MVTLFSPQPVVTPADATNALATNGLDALGLTAPTLASAWASAGAAAATYDANQLTLTLGAIRAPFRGILSFAAAAPEFSAVDGRPIGTSLAILRLHPDAARRLEKLIDQALGAAARAMPVPVAMAVHDCPATVAVAPNWFVAGEPLVANSAGAPALVSGGAGSTTATISFHDNRGLPIDPVAVAAMFEHLLGRFAALGVAAPNTPALNAANVGLTALASIPGSDRIHVVDPHGWPFVSDVAHLQVGVTALADTGLADFGAGTALARASGEDDAARPVRFGWARGGALGNAALAVPAEPPSPWIAGRRRFFRAMAVDLAWHLLGNRTTNIVRGVPADDGASIASALPQVRVAVPGFDYLSDAMDVLGAVGQAAQQFEAAGPGGDLRAILVSPEIDDTLALPQQPRALGRWPAFPAPVAPGGQALALGRLALAGKLHAYRDPAVPRDVVVAIDAAVFPVTAGVNGPHVRIHPRRFVEIASIEPGVRSFERGDGAAAIVTPGARTAVRLVNPLGLTAGQPLPGTIVVDVVAIDRANTRRIASGQTLVIEDMPTTDPPTPVTLADFGGVPAFAGPLLSSVAQPTRALAPSGLFGVAEPGGASAPFAKALLSEESPRRGPRLPTQMRFETIVALGRTPSGSTQLAFDAVLTGARLVWESRSRRPDLGDPGNPAGPDVYAAGVRCQGALAYDLAFHGMKRALPIAPTGAATLGWAATTAGDNWNPPAADAGGTVAGAMLETTAWGSDSPELALDQVPDPPIAAPPAWLTVDNAGPIRARLDREITTAKHGQRDALWSLARAFTQARECIYVEGPGFTPTAAQGDPAKHAIDLLRVLRQAMMDNPRLKLIVCLPRFPDFATPAKANWERAALRERKRAIQTFYDVGVGARLAAFHPVGFPGRAAAIRSTAIVVDDAYAMIGTSHLRRRGMTFDGAVDVASIDCATAAGYSRDVAVFRRELMAAKLGIEPPATPGQAVAHWIRLATLEGAFDLVADLLGTRDGPITPIWAGPEDSDIEITTLNQIDPDGGPGSDTAALFAGLL